MFIVRNTWKMLDWIIYSIVIRIKNLIHSITYNLFVWNYFIFNVIFFILYIEILFLIFSQDSLDEAMKEMQLSAMSAANPHLIWIGSFYFTISTSLIVPKLWNLTLIQTLFKFLFWIVFFPMKLYTQQSRSLL